MLLAGGPAAVAAAAESATAGPAAAAAEQVFDVWEYRVLGNTVMSNREIEGVLYPKLGPGKHFADLDAARAALEEAYHSLGYATVYVDIPPQQVIDGIVRLHVTEGRLRQRSISGAQYFPEREVLEQLPATQPGTVPKLTELQQQLNAVNSQSADRSVVPVLKAGSEPGTMDLALKVTDHLPLHGSLELDNQYSPDTRPLRATASLSYDNLFGALDALTAQYTFTPQQSGQVGVFGANYAFHPIAGGARFALSFTNSSSSVVTLGTLGVLGRGQIFSGHVTVPLRLDSAGSQFLSAGLDYKRFRNTLDLAEAGAVIQPISYLNASVGYSGSWQQFAAGAAAEAPASLRRAESLSLLVNFGPRGFANSAADFSSNRYQGRGNYIYLRSDASFTTRLPWSFQLLLRAQGQLAPNALIVYEQMALTGASAVRGYLEGEELDDSALRGTLQLQSPPLTRRAVSWADGFLFFDAAQGHRAEANVQIGEPNHTQLRSFGAGLDLLPGHPVYGSLTWADPLLPGARTPAHEARWLFDLKGAF